MKFPRVLSGLTVLLFAVTAATAQPAGGPEREARARQAAADRLAYAASDAYNPYDTVVQDAVDAAGEALSKKDYAEAIAAAERELANSPCSVELLVILAAACRESGDVAKANETKARWMSLVDSILASGDGRSYETAFHVINVHEEYTVLRILRLQPAGQSLREHNGSQFDVMEATAPGADKKIELFFNIDLPKQWLDRKLAKAN